MKNISILGRWIGPYALLLGSLLCTGFEPSARAEASALYPVVCENKSQCPDWVLGLSYAVKSSAGPTRSVCSGSLVDTDVVMTNLHCLPDSLKISGQNCSHEIQVVFPETQNSPQLVVDCDRILWVSPPLNGNHLRLDYAFLKLKKAVPRQPLKISQSGISDQMNLSLYKVDPQTEQTSLVQGVVKKIQCPAVQYSLLNPYFIADRAPLVTLGRCDIIKGNSGSALIGEDGRAYGIVNSVTDFDWTRELQSKYKIALDKVRMAFGTNLSCVPSVEEVIQGQNPKIPAVCQINLDESTRQRLNQDLVKMAVKQSIQQINQKVNQQMKSLAVDGDHLFYWSAIQDELTDKDKEEALIAQVTVQPQCLLPGVQHIEKYVGQLKNKNVTFHLQQKTFVIKEKMDEFLRYQTFMVESSKNIEVVLNPKTLVQRKNIPIEIIDQTSKSKTQQKRTMDLCYQLKKVTEL